VLRALLLTGLVAAPVASLLMFLPLPAPHRTRGAWPFARRLLGAALATAAVGALAFACSVWWRVPHRDAVSGAAALVVFSVLWLPATRRWNGRAHLCWACSTYLYLAYLAFIVVWTFQSHLGAAGTVGAMVLWSLEVVAGLFGAAYLWELCDALGTENWRRRITARGLPADVPGTYLPFVSLHVPAHNEPPEMVIQTLTALTQLDYPAFEIIAIDDNTDDPQLWLPVQSWCAANGVRFQHLSDWPGFKSGALNYALAELTDPRAEVIGVVDSDYLIAPNFLRRCAPLFADESIAFVQAPQDYRDWKQSSYYRRLYYSYRYFFAVSQPARNEHDAAIFAGTMGLIRRSTLQALGGWNEWCITEDAELSLRLLANGWSGLHIDESFGRGVMPLTFEALKSQRYRWCFGGIQILRMHRRALVGTRSSRLNRAQRWGYLAGGLQWYGDLLGVLFYLFLLAGALNLATGGGQLFRKLTGFLVAAVPILVGLGLLRAVALLRRGTGASWRDAVGAFFVWQSTSLVVARASVQGLFAREAVFLRTPKTFDAARFWQVVRANWAETLLAVLGVAGIAGALIHPGGLSGPLLAALLVLPTLGFAAAPLNSLAAQRAALPAELRQRRRTEFLRAGAGMRGVVYGGTAAFVAGVGIVLALLITPSPGSIQPPRLVAPKHSTSSTTRHPTHSTSPSTVAPATASTGPSSAPPSTSAPASPTATPTATPTPSSAGSATPTTTTTTTP
jgi:glycosyltransferase involved in cell wall biosynthesis